MSLSTTSGEKTKDSVEYNERTVRKSCGRVFGVHFMSYLGRYN